MATSDDNAAHQIVMKYCFERGLTPVQTKREMETIERHTRVSNIGIHLAKKV